jgi:REP element-mobilizing transposase RayT
MSRQTKHVLLPFGRTERAKNRGVRLGRPPKPGSVSHQTRQVLPKKSVLHVTLSASAKVPNLRAGFRFNDIKEAFAKFHEVEIGKGNSFRLVHYNVLGDHLHLVVEADSREALSNGMRKLNHSISRRLNRSSVLRAGGTLNPRDKTPLSKRPGWLGRVFAARYHARRLKSAPEIDNVVRYVLRNGQKHFGHGAARRVAQGSGQLLARLETFSSVNVEAKDTVSEAHSFLVRRAFGRWREALRAPAEPS